MNRLMLVIGPIACFLGGIAISELLHKSCVSLSPLTLKKGYKWPSDVSFVLIGAISFLLVRFSTHCNWAAQTMYSSPSIVITAHMGGQTVLIDDYREAYSWLRYNTPENATVMSWWDYGYQITGMSDRTTLADGNTWNNTHIAQIGKVKLFLYFKFASFLLFLIIFWNSVCLLQKKFAIQS